MKKGFIEVFAIVGFLFTSTMMISAVVNDTNTQSKQYKKVSEDKVISSMKRDAERQIKIMNKEV